MPPRQAGLVAGSQVQGATSPKNLTGSTKQVVFLELQDHGDAKVAQQVVDQRCRIGAGCGKVTADGWTRMYSPLSVPPTADGAAGSR